jgi:predicted membrane channel-forming protein YqfA (hemolysin III family)
MKKILLRLFPLGFALLTAIFYVLLYHPPVNSVSMTSACLVFLAALGWSTMVVLRRKNERWLKILYVLMSILAAILLIEIIRPFPVELLSHRLMVAMIGMGIAAIEYYFYILRKKTGDKAMTNNQASGLASAIKKIVART